LAPEDLARLQRVAVAARDALGADGEWLAGYVATWLVSRPKIDIRARDSALRALAAGLPGYSGSALVAAVGAALLRYETTRWRADSHRAEMPIDYAGTAFESLFRAFRSGGGKVPRSDKQLARILLNH